MPAEKVNDFLEYLNGAWGILELCMFGFMATYFVHEVIARNIRLADCLFWRTNLPLHMQAAAALVTMATGTAMVRLSVWYWRHYESSVVVFAPGPVFVSGSIIATFGILCAIRVFTLYWLGNWAWVFSFTAAALFTLLTHFEVF